MSRHRLFPADALPLTLAALPDTLQRVPQSARVVHSIAVAGPFLAAARVEVGHVLVRLRIVRGLLLTNHQPVLDVHVEGTSALVPAVDVMCSLEHLIEGCPLVIDVLPTLVLARGQTRTGRGMSRADGCRRWPGGQPAQRQGKGHLAGPTQELATRNSHFTLHSSKPLSQHRKKMRPGQCTRVSRLGDKTYESMGSRPVLPPSLGSPSLTCVQLARSSRLALCASAWSDQRNGLNRFDLRSPERCFGWLKWPFFQPNRHSKHRATASNYARIGSSASSASRTVSRNRRNMGRAH